MRVCVSYLFWTDLGSSDALDWLQHATAFSASGCQAAHCTGLILGTGIILAFLGGF
jgi:hypothetical protein